MERTADKSDAPMSHMIQKVNHIADGLSVIHIDGAGRYFHFEIGDVLADVDNWSAVFPDPHELLLGNLDVGHNDAFHLLVLQYVEEMNFFFQLPVGLTYDDIVSERGDYAVDSLQDPPETENRNALSYRLLTETEELWFMTLDTVEIETPAASAT